MADEDWGQNDQIVEQSAPSDWGQNDQEVSRNHDPAQPETTALGAGVREFVRNAIPSAVGGIAGLGTAAALSEATPFVSVPAGFAAGAWAAGATRKLQDSITDSLGLDSPESRERDTAEHPTASTVGGVASAAVTFNPASLEANLADRVLNGGIMGGINAGLQFVEKGTVDPTEVAINAAGGAALGKPYKYAEKGAGYVSRAFGVDPTVEAAIGGDKEPAANPPRLNSPARQITDQSKFNMGPPEPEAPTINAGAAPEYSPAQRGLPAPGEQRLLPAPRAEVPGAENMPGHEGLPEGAFGYEGPQRPPFEPEENARSIGEFQPPEWGAGDQEVKPGASQPTPGAEAVKTSQARSAPTGEEAAAQLRDALQKRQNEAKPAEQAAETSQQRSIPLTLAEKGWIKRGSTWVPPEKQTPEEIAARTGRAPEVPAREEPAAAEPVIPAQEPVREQVQPASPKQVNRVEESAPKADIPPRQEEVATASAADQKAARDRELTDIIANSRDPEARKQAFRERTALYGDDDVREQPWNQARVAEASKATDEQISKEAPKPQSLGAGAAEGSAFQAQEPLGAVGAKNAGIWQSVNKSLDRLFKLPQWILAPHTISEKGELADRIFSKNLGLSTTELAQHQKSLEAQSAYFDNLPKDHRTSVVTDYENGAVAADHPGRHFMGQARSVADKFDEQLHATPNAMKNYLGRLSSFFEDMDGAREFIKDFQNRNNRPPSLGEVMKEGKFKLSHDLTMRDGSPDPLKVINQQNLAKSQAIRLTRTIDEGRNGWNAGPGIGRADPILHDSPRPGDVQIDDRLTGGLKLYGAPEVNAVLSRGFHPELRDPSVRNAYDAYMRLKGASVAWDLLGGLYHMRFMALEAPINEIATGMARLLKNPEYGLKDIAKSVASPYTLFKAGKNNVLDALMYPDKVKDPFTKTVNKILAEAGMLPPVRVRGMGVTPELETGVMQGLTTAWKPAWQQFMRDTVQEGLKLKDRAANLKNSAADSGGKLAKDTGLYALRTVGEALQTIMHPLFNWYIPLLKAGAVHNNMARFIIDNPGLSHDDYVNMGRKFVRAVDNAMGEMNQSTIYAPPMIKALGNATMVSPSWNVGDVKQFFGGARAFLRNPASAMTGKDYDPRIMYIPAFVAATAMFNIAAQVLHGQGLPQDATDVAFPRTGGRTKKGNPERLIQPGYEKDVAEVANVLGGPEPSGKAFMHMMYNKLAPFPKTLMDEFIFNQNFAGKDIANPNDPFMKRLQAYAGYFVKQTMEPIMLQQYLHEEKNKGTHISKGEQMLLGNRHAPEQWQDPQQYAERHRKENDKNAKAAKKFHENTGY